MVDSDSFSILNS